MGMGMKYIRLTENGFSVARLVPESVNIIKHAFAKRNVPWFFSTFRYNKEQKEYFDNTGSVSGLRNVTTNLVYWDFDSNDVDIARASTLKLIERLQAEGFKEDQIKINFSGRKGFHVYIETDQEFTPNQVLNIADKFAGDLTGFDTTMYDANQVLRVPLTKHEKSGVFCTPITLEDLNVLTKEQLVENAKNVDGFDLDGYLSYYTKAHIPENLLVPAVKEIDFMQETKSVEVKEFDLAYLDFSEMPRYMDEARWALMNGYFRGSETGDVGERNHALLCLAATYRNMGYDRVLVKSLLNGVIELQASRTGETPFSERELERNILDMVYSPTWRGGQFSVHDPDSWLFKYAKKMGIKVEAEMAEEPITIGDLDKGFRDFVVNIDKNTIKTGIKCIDDVLPITTGNNLGLVGSAGSGKTALMLEILKNTSKAGVVTVVASLDMYRNRIFEKLLYKVSGLDRKELYHRIKMGEADDIIAKVKEDYGNVWFYDRSAATIKDIKRYVLAVEQKTGQKVKLVMIDYFERVNSDVSDDTAASKKVSNEIQDMLNDLNIAVVTAVQPNKFSLGGGPDTPILSYTAIKGSSFLYQSFRSIISIWRPFYRPDLKENDRFMQMAILKNDLGELATFDFSWNGKRGEINELEDIERRELKELLKQKDNAKDESDGWD